MNFIFDMDGLMFDTERVFIKAWDYAGEKTGIGRAGYMVHKTLGMNIKTAYDVWKEEFGDKYNQEEVRKHSKDFLEKYYHENPTPIKEGLYVLLDYLRGLNCKMAVASSSPRWEVERHLRSANVTDYFVGAACGDMVQNSKPAPDLYLKACEILGASPEACFALEDSKNGLLAAYRAGCKPIMIPDLWQPDGDVLKIILAKYGNLEQVKCALETGDLNLQEGKCF